MAKRRSHAHAAAFEAMNRLYNIDELLSLRGELDNLIAEKKQFAKEQEEQRQAKEIEITEATRAAVVGAQPAKGYVETKIINGRPYRYLRYWDAGKLKSQYIGKAEQVVPA